MADAELDEDATAFGLDPAELRNRPEESFCIEHGNWQAWELFIDCQSQWRTLVTATGSVVRTALDLTAVSALIALYKPSKPKRLLRQVILIQQGAVAQMNKIPLETLFGE